MTYSCPWKYEGKLFDSNDLATRSDIMGFVYEIHSLNTNKRYIGKKNFYSKKIVQKNLKKKKVRVESDWKNYYSSCVELQDEIKKFGNEKIERTIIHLCRSKGEMNYRELKEQVINDVLLRDDYYNSFVGTKIHRRHLKFLNTS